MGAAPAGAFTGLQQHPVGGERYSPHYLMFGRRPHLPVDYYFPTVSAFKCSRRMPACVMEVRRWFKAAYAEAHLQINCKAKKQKWYYDKTTSIAQLVLGDVVLMKNDAYQGKWKVKDQWSETEHVVVCQVADGIPAYEVKDEAGNIKTVHHNQLFLVAAPVGAVTPLGGRYATFRRKHCSIHPCGMYLIGGREQVTRGIRGWG